MIENPPVITDAIYPMQIMQIMSAPVYQDLLLKIEKEYLYWDKIKYLGDKTLPSEVL